MAFCWLAVSCRNKTSKHYLAFFPCSLPNPYSMAREWLMRLHNIPDLQQCTVCFVVFDQQTCASKIKGKLGGHVMDGGLT